MNLRLRETKGNDTIWYLYDNIGAVGLELNGIIYYYIRNLSGDVTKIVDASGNTVVQYAYDAWGKVLSTTGSLASTVGAKNPIRYRGYYYDTESNLYYLMSRYYDPETGRFISRRSSRRRQPLKLKLTDLGFQKRNKIYQFLVNINKITEIQLKIE